MSDETRAPSCEETLAILEICKDLFQELHDLGEITQIHKIYMEIDSILEFYTKQYENLPIVDRMRRI